MTERKRPVRSRLPALLLGAVCAAAPLLAQDAPPAAPESGVVGNGPLTLEQAVQIAREHHPSLAIAHDQLRSARGGILQARSGFFPSLSFSSGFSRSKSSGSAVISGVPVGESGNRFSTQYSTSLQGQQLLFDFGRTRDAYRQSRFQEQATRYQLAQTEDDVVYNVQQAFVVLLTNEELLEVARYSYRLNEGSLAMAQAQFDAGAAPRADVAKAQSALAAAQL
jgi:outer membrane protein